MNVEFGAMVSEWDVVQFVEGIHYNKEDFVEGDLRLSPAPS